MKRRTRIWTAAVVGLAGTLLAGAAAFAVAGPGMRDGMMRRVAVAMIDDALDRAQVTPEQRASIHATRDRLFAVLEQERGTRRGRMAEVLAAFEGDTLDTGRLQAVRAEMEARHARVADAVEQALAEVHAVLTPGQRTALADYVRAHRHRRH